MKFLARSIVLLLVVSSTLASHADTISLGVLSFDTLIVGAPGAPGTNAFTIGNFTGAFALSPDFPVVTDLTFVSALLQLNLLGGGSLSIPLGNIGPGFLLDPLTGVPPFALQFADTTQFTSAVFTASLLQSSFVLSNGSTMFPVSGIQVTLLSLNGTLVPGDFTVITVEAVPEPGTLLLLGIGLVLALYPGKAGIRGAT